MTTPRRIGEKAIGSAAVQWHTFTMRVAGAVEHHGTQGTQGTQGTPGTPGTHTGHCGYSAVLQRRPEQGRALVASGVLAVAAATVLSFR